MVERAAPFQRTTELVAKFDPETMRVKAALPTAADVGERLDTEGEAAKEGATRKTRFMTNR